VNHRLPHVFRTCLALRVSHSNIVSSSVVFDNERVIDGEIRGTLLELGHWVPASRHYLLNKLICFRQCTLGIVDESALDLLPGCYKIRPSRRWQFVYLETLYSFCEFLEFRFRLRLAACFFNCSLVFGAKTGLKSLATLTFNDKHNRMLR
jgi:hypothetical protein